MPGLFDFYLEPTDPSEPFQLSPEWAALQRYLDPYRALPRSLAQSSEHHVTDEQASAMPRQRGLASASRETEGEPWLHGLRTYLGNSFESLARAPSGLTGMGRDFVTDPALFLNRAGPGLAGLGMTSPFARGTAASASRARAGLGDLTIDEVNQIQAAVDRAGRPLEVVGSAARAARSARSDIDYIAPPGTLPYFQGLENKLPGLNPRHGIVPGIGNPNIGPVIRFEPRR